MVAGVVLSAAFLASPAAAQFVQQIPFPQTQDLLVVDSGFDGVHRLSDLTLDGDYNDPGEIAVFYSDTIGSIALTNPNCVAMGPDGVAYVGDSSERIILRLCDNNGDGDALDPGEHSLFFDGNSNGSGIFMASIQGLTVDVLGNVLAAVSNTGAGGDDMILQLQDLNGDGDANDAGEATVFYSIPTGSVGDSIPTQVRVGPGGRIYYTDVGATGVVTKGVYQLFDANGNGNANDPGEATLFWTPPAPGNAFYWGLAVDHDGTVFISDHGNETIWQARDLNGDGVIQANEEQLFYQSTASTWWELLIRSDGVLLACEDQTPDRVTAFEDLNGNGSAMDPGEMYEAYSELVSSTQIKPRAAALFRGPSMDVSPSSVPVGQQISVTVATTKPGEFVFIAYSTGTALVPYRPFGRLELDPNAVISFNSGVSNNLNTFGSLVTVPNDPVLVGTYYFQALSGPLSRMVFTNVATVTITP